MNMVENVDFFLNFAVATTRKIVDIRMINLSDEC